VQVRVEDLGAPSNISIPPGLGEAGMGKRCAGSMPMLGILLEARDRVSYAACRSFALMTFSIHIFSQMCDKEES
jgi:hypothetical protein